MAYNRIDELDDSQLVTTLDGIFKDLDEIKNRQLVGGDIITPIILQTDNAYDYVSTINNQLDFNVTFTADHQTSPYIYPILVFFDLSGNSVPFSSIEEVDFDYSAASGPVNGNWNDYKAYLDVFILNTFRFQVKLKLVTSDTGNLQLTRLI